MNLAKLVPEVRALPRSDKLQLLQILAVELTQGDVVSMLRPGVEYRVESQFDAPEAAKTLQQLLDNQHTL